MKWYAFIIIVANISETLFYWPFRKFGVLSMAYFFSFPFSFIRSFINLFFLYLLLISANHYWHRLFLVNVLDCGCIFFSFSQIAFSGICDIIFMHFSLSALFSGLIECSRITTSVLTASPAR